MDNYDVEFELEDGCLVFPVMATCSLIAIDLGVRAFYRDYPDATKRHVIRLIPHLGKAGGLAHLPNVAVAALPRPRVRRG